jgi:hypothetical protein
MVKHAVLLLACSGCSLITDSFATNEFSGDEFPTYVDTRSGGVLVGLRSGSENHIAVLDVLSPLTLIDPGVSAETTVDLEDLTLVGDATGGNLGTYATPRASFTNQQVLRVHPCANSEPLCKVGLPAVETEFSAIIGADALAGDALRMRLRDNQIFVLADVGGSDADRTYACDAVFPSPYRGGGTLIIAGTEVPFAGRRVTVQACLGADPSIFVTQAARGTDALFAMSTAIGPSLLSESAYERYRFGHPTAPPLSTLPETQLALPSGPVGGRLVTIENLALVARASSEPLAPCRQFYAHHLLTARNCLDADDCPCEDSGRFCPVPASVDVRPAAGIDILVVSDDDATLQALRTEFRPSIQEIDGILGTGALRDLELDIDYSHNRFLARCARIGEPECVTRPAIESESDRTQIRGCPNVVSSTITPRGAFTPPAK